MIERYRAFNEWLAGQMTDKLGTMECAYAFAVLALLRVLKAQELILREVHKIARENHAIMSKLGLQED